MHRLIDDAGLEGHDEMATAIRVGGEVVERCRSRAEEARHDDRVVPRQVGIGAHEVGDHVALEERRVPGEDVLDVAQPRGHRLLLETSPAIPLEHDRNPRIDAAALEVREAGEVGSRAR